MLNLSKLKGFEWDKANIDKNWKRRGVYWRECEEVFINLPLLVFLDKTHSTKEIRFCVLGKTNDNRKIFIVLTVRNNKIRIISARDQNRKEKEIYGKAKKTI